MIVVDTSVWIGAKKDAGMLSALDSLIDADEVVLARPVRLELWAGTSKRHRAELARTLSALIQAVPSEETWASLPARVERATDAGEWFSLSDHLIAALSEEVGGLVWSMDSDFERMERLGLVRLYDPA